MNPFSKDLLESKISAMTISDAVHTCPAETKLSEVLKTLQLSKVGSIIITDGGGTHPVGIFTERDYLMKVAGKVPDPDSVTVESFMTKSPVCFTKDDSIGKVLGRMKTAGFRHIIVTDAEGSLQGVISIRDAMNFIYDRLMGD